MASCAGSLRTSAVALLLGLVTPLWGVPPVATRPDLVPGAAMGSTPGNPGCLKPGDHMKGRVMVKLHPAGTAQAAPLAPGMPAGASLSDEEVLASIRRVKGFKALRPHFPQALPPKAGAKVMGRDGKAVAEPDLTRWHRVDLEDAEDVPAKVRELQALPGVAVAEPDFLRKMADQPLPDATTDPMVKDQWHLAAVHAPEAWAYLKAKGLAPGGSRDVVVAVIDTGIDLTHPDLSANLWTGADGSHGYNAITQTTDPTDDHGHGTHVAGIIAAQANNSKGGVGIAYNTQIMAIKAAQYSGVLAASDIARGILWAVSHGADVINMSFGGYAKATVEEDALAVAFGQAVLVAAAGNDGLVNEFSMLGKPMYPAAYTWVLGVMASNPTASAKGDWMASYSNWDGIPNNTFEYELMAPGTQVWSTLPGGQYAAWSGTSMAAPVVSGIAALVRTKFPDRSVYSSRFIMGQIAGTGALQQAFTPEKGDPVSYRSADALAALTYAPKPELTYLGFWLFDTLTQSPTNIPNGRVDAGETIDLAITIRNRWGKADPVSVKLEPVLAGAMGPDPYVTMVTDTVDYGAVGAFSADDNGLRTDSLGAVISVEHPFTFKVKSDTPNGHIIPFKVTITAKNGFDPTDTTVYTTTATFQVAVTNGRELPRLIDKDMTLDKGTLWIVPDQTLIQEGVTVTVTAGAKVQFYSSQSLTVYANEPHAYLLVKGTLDVVGTQEEPVELFLDSKYIDRAIEIQGGNSKKVSFKYAKIENPCISGSTTYITNNNTGNNSWIYNGIIDHCEFICTGDYWWSATINGQNYSFMPVIYGLPINKSRFRNMGSAFQETWKTEFPVPMVVSETLFESSILYVSLYDSPNGTISNTVFLNNSRFGKYSSTLPGTTDVIHPSTSEFFVTTTSGDSYYTPGPMASNNAFLERYVNPVPKDWPRFRGNGMSTAPNIKNNYWGTASPTIIDAMIWDFNDDITLQTLTYQPILTTAPVTAYPFVVDVALTNADGKPVSIVGAETVTFTVTFNRDMDKAVAPQVSFGPAEPYTDYTVSPSTYYTKFAVNGAWKDARTWVGTFKMTPITGDGYQYIRVAGAVAANDPWLVTGVDSARFRFEIITSGTESMDLQAGSGEGKVILTWTQNDFDLLTGYNLYRSEASAGTFARINRTVIPKQTTGYMDTTVNPGKTYYYKFTVVKSDGTESDSFSNVASAAALDTIPPSILHTPVTSSPAGLPVSLSAQVTDNVAVQSVTLYSRTIGSAAYASRTMTNTTGSTYVATLEGSLVAAPGVEYYLVATDGITPAQAGYPDLPYQIRVTDNPVPTGISPATGSAAGGTTVTLTGANFKTGAAVTFGGVSAGTVTLLSANQLTCVTPAHFPASVDVVVTNPGLAAGTLLRAYSYTSDQVTLALPTLSAAQSTVVQVPLSGTAVQGLLAADLSLTYDPAILKVRATAVGSLTRGWTLQANTSTAGQVRLALASTTPVTGSGTLAVIDFEVLGAPGTSSTLGLATARLNDGALTVTSANGVLNVKVAFTLAGTARHWKSYSAIPGVALQVTGDRVYAATSDASGAYSVASVPGGTYVVQPSKSDGVNGITAYDASLVLQHAAGLIALSGQAATAADVDKSGTITSLDAAYILQRASGLLSGPFPGAGVVWQFSPASQTISNLSSNLSGLDFTGLLIGDVSGNWTSQEAGLAAPRWLPAVAAQAIDVRLAESLPTPDKALTATLGIGPRGQEVYSLDAVLTYDATKAVPGVPGLATGTSDWLLSANTTVPGEIRVAMATARPLSADTLLLSFPFNLAAGATSANLRLQTVKVNEDKAANLQYAVAVARVGNGSGTVTSTPAGLGCGSSCTAYFDAGTALTLTPVAEVGSAFAGWTGALTGTGTGVLTVDGSRQVTAQFTLLAPATLAWSKPSRITYGTALGSAQLNATASMEGTFTYDPPAGTVLKAGAGQVLKTTFQPKDAQYLPVSTTVTLDVDQAPQTLSFSAVTGLVAGGSAVTLQGSSSAGLTVGFASSNPAVVSVSGNRATPLTRGTAVLTASQAGDSNHLAAADVTQTVTVAPTSTAPTLAVASLPHLGVTADSVLNVSGQATSPNGIQTVTVNGTSVPLQAGGAFSHALRLSAGSNTITTVATDTASQPTTVTRTVTLDETVPTVAVAFPSDNATLAASTVTVTGTVTLATGSSDPVSGVTYALEDGSTYTATYSGGSFSFPVAAHAGLNQVQVTATTAAGKKAQAKVSFTGQAPFSLAVTDPGRDTATTSTTYLVKGTVGDATGTVSLTLKAGSASYAPTLSGGSFQQSVSLDANQVWPIVVTGVDGAGRSLTVLRNLIKAPPAVPTFTLTEAFTAATFVTGSATPTTADLSRYDVAPLVNGVPTGDGRIDVEDLVVILRKALGLPL